MLEMLQRTQIKVLQTDLIVSPFPIAGLNIGKLDLIQSRNNMPSSFKWASVNKEALLQSLEVKKAGIHLLLAFPPQQVQSARLNLQREHAQLSLPFSK